MINNGDLIINKQAQNNEMLVASEKKFSNEELENRKNFLYNKVGVILSDLCCDDNVQQSLLTYDEKINLNEIKNKEIKVMNVVDKINNRFGYGKLRLSSDTVGSFFYKNKKKINWSMKSNYRSPCYTTKWCDIPKIKV